MARFVARWRLSFVALTLLAALPVAAAPFTLSVLRRNTSVGAPRLSRWPLRDPAERPEPGTGALLVIGLLLLGARRAHRR
jgi:hypothetical protein